MYCNYVSNKEQSSLENKLINSESWKVIITDTSDTFSVHLQQFYEFVLNFYHLRWKQETICDMYQIQCIKCKCNHILYGNKYNYFV